MDKILIIMSTYNGEQYIKEQIDSIQKQKNVEIFLLIRDDGSTDSTVNVINKLEVHNLVLQKGENIGVAKSFLELMQCVARDYSEFEYIALADQDDIWKEDKLSHAIELLKQNEADLYCGSLDAFTNAVLDKHLIIRCTEYTFFETLLRNSVAGCTMVMRRNVLERVCEYMPNFVEMHDSWIIRVCKYTGMKIIWDKEAFMRYRLHKANTCGVAVSIFSKVKVHFYNVFRRDPEQVSFTAKELLNGYRRYFSKEEQEFFELFDKSSQVDKRKFKLLRKCLTEKFSSFSRKVDFVIEVLIGNI